MTDAVTAPQPGDADYIPAGFPAPGHPGYRVTASGLVVGRHGRPMKPESLDGYQRVCVADETGRRYRVMVHRLVALTFFGPCPLFHQVNHINGDRACNWVSNLEYVTAGENVQHSFARLDRRVARGEANANAVLTDDAVREMRRRRAAGESAAHLAVAFGIRPDHVWRICTGRSWRHIR